MSDEKNWYDRDEDNNTNSYVYGNNSGPYYGTPSEPAGTNARFAKSSMVCGIISMCLTITGFFAIPLSALGLFFANMSARKGKAFPGKARIGIATSIIGLVVGVIVSSYSAMTIYSMIKQGNFFEQYEQIGKQLYGSDFSLEDYGIDVNGFKDFQDYLNSTDTITR